MSEFLFTSLRNIVFIFVVAMWFKYFSFLLIAPFYPIKEHRRYLKSTKRRVELGFGTNYTPKVSVIIPAWNEEVGILKTIDSVVKDGYPNLEIVVVNDGSTDNSDRLTKEYIKELIKSDKTKKNLITYFYKENGGKGKALNTGIMAAKGEIILTMDADSAIKPGGISNLVKYYRDPEIMCVVGNVRVGNNSTVIGLLQHLEYYFGFYFKRAYAMLGAEYIFGGACASFRKSVFETIGLFDDENKTEDIEMSMRCRYAGYKSTYAEDVITYTEGASTILGLINQRIRWKKGRFDTFWKYRSMFYSTDDRHNPFLSFFVLPYAMLSEIQLIFEPIAISVLLAYSFISSDYLSLAIGLFFIFQIYLVTAFFHGEKPNLKILLSFPFTWTLFYFLVWIEFLALYKSITMVFSGKDIVWQKWDRQGVSK
jgi:poly-beta-1,6-N-acetyl-D-glucosamine synthase